MRNSQTYTVITSILIVTKVNVNAQKYLLKTHALLLAHQTLFVKETFFSSFFFIPHYIKKVCDYFLMLLNKISKKIDKIYTRIFSYILSMFLSFFAASMLFNPRYFNWICIQWYSLNKEICIWNKYIKMAPCMVFVAKTNK